jgi:hypothetical protein
MRRSNALILLIGVVTLLSIWIVFQFPGSSDEILLHPIQAIIGTQKQLNATLYEVSESAEPVRAAGRRLLQPFGVVRLVRTYDAPDSDRSKKH